MRFKGEQVWVRADESGQLVLDAEGRAEMKYRETDNKSYRPSLEILSPTGRPGAPPPETDAARQQARRRCEGAGAAQMPSAGGLEIGPTAPARATRGRWGSAWSSSTAPPARSGEYLGIGTNNIAELTAIERGLDGGPTRAAPNARLHRFELRDRRAGKGWKAKANQELIARSQARSRRWTWSSSRSPGTPAPENERCDELAREAINGR